VVAVVGSVRLAGSNNSSSGASLSAGTGSPSAAAGAAGGSADAASVRMVQSGRDYRERTLAAQARSLLALGRVAGATPSASAPPTKAPAVPRPSAASGRSLAPGATSIESGLAADPAAADVTNPARLAACLKALGVAPDRLVAVDLARYEGREAAILLLTAADGNGHEVWAVERTCAPGMEGALKYTHLPG
jgi:hypothetical protein